MDMGNAAHRYWNDWGPGAIGNLFGGGQDPAKAANEYYDKIPGTLHENYDPWINRGKQAGDSLQGQYDSLLGNPGGKLNDIGQNYQQSPGFKFAMQQALQGGNHAAAAGGMAGSPQHEQQNMTMATNLANQDYNQWIKNALGLYGTGIQGEQGMYGIGAQAGMGLGENLASNLAQQGQIAAESANSANQRRSGMIGQGIGAASSALAAFSSIALKDKIDTPSTAEILNNVRELSLDRWKYKDINQSFLGTYAEEFADRFGVGDGKTINMVDMLGVLMGAVKELDKKLSAMEKQHGNSIS